jgi:hypothetical protein
MLTLLTRCLSLHRMASSGMLRRYSETSVLTRSTRRNIPEVAILHSLRSENLRSYKHLRRFSRSPQPHETLSTTRTASFTDSLELDYFG